MSFQSQLVSFIQKQNGIQLNNGLLFDMHFFIARTQSESETVTNAGYWVLSEVSKNNSLQEKPICPNRKN